MQWTNFSLRRLQQLPGPRLFPQQTEQSLTECDLPGFVGRMEIEGERATAWLHKDIFIW